MTQQQFYNLILKSQRWTQDEISEFQRERLEPLLRHARRSSPFYRFRLNPLFDRSDNIDWSRWNEIPILTRSDVVNYSQSLNSKEIPIAHQPISKVSSSGSTGHPVSIMTTKWLLEMSQACGWRAQAWANFDWSKTLLMRNYKEMPGKENGDRLGPWGPPWSSEARKGNSYYFSFRASHEEFFDFMVAKRPSYVLIYTQSIDELARIASTSNEHIKIDYFISRGEAVTGETRQRAYEIFGAKILEQYSSQECGLIAAPCPDGDGFHTSAEMCHVEIIRDDGTPAREGEDGRVIVTNFGSTANPLIRYDQGDRAVMGGKCSCGRNLPLVKKILGRSHHAFKHPDGRRVFGPRAEKGRALLGAERWQIVQTGPTHFTVNYVSNVEADMAQQRAFVTLFKAMIFEDAEIIMQRVNADFFNTSGKFQEYRNDWVDPVVTIEP